MYLVLFKYTAVKALIIITQILFISFPVYKWTYILQFNYNYKNTEEYIGITRSLYDFTVSSLQNQSTWCHNSMMMSSMNHSRWSHNSMMMSSVKYSTWCHNEDDIIFIVILSDQWCVAPSGKESILSSPISQTATVELLYSWADTPLCQQTKENTLKYQ